MEQEYRIWGHYDVLYEDDHAKLKHLYIEPGKNISYQYHNHRDEIWTIVSGKGRLILDGAVRDMAPGDSVRIKVGQRHMIRCTGDETLVIHEIQTGTEFLEEDIVRLPTPEELF